MGLQGMFETIRKWIDGEEDLDDKGKPRPRSKWEDFMVAIAREVEHKMHEEMFTPPGGPTYIPREYLVFLSPADDADWQGEKREGLQRGLHYVLSERAKELVGSKDFQTKTFTVELRVDAALEAGHFRVQHIWDTSSPKTIVKPRKLDQLSNAAAPTTVVVERGEEPTLVLPSTLADEKDDEATIVRPRPRPARDPIFSVSVRRVAAGNEASASTGTTADMTNDIRPFDKEEITIGRGSRQIAVDLKLEGDLEVSRKHATLAKRQDGHYVITCHGANAIVLGGTDSAREVATGETTGVEPDQPITISTYELRILGN